MRRRGERCGATSRFRPGSFLMVGGGRRQISGTSWSLCGPAFSSSDSFFFFFFFYLLRLLFHIILIIHIFSLPFMYFMSSDGVRGCSDSDVTHFLCLERKSANSLPKLYKQNKSRLFKFPTLHLQKNSFWFCASKTLPANK